MELSAGDCALRLRRPVESDLTAVVEIHSDPDTNLHNPDGPMRDVEQGRVLLESWLVDWREHGIGYWTVEVDPRHLSEAPDSESGWQVVGFSGVRHLPAGPGQVLNLYYRYAPAAWGRGWATTVALRACEAARVRAPQTPVIARMQADHTASHRVARKAGLHQVGYDLGGRPVLADRALGRSAIEGLPLI
jgi:RimJ/RimL family protein N-acetyltransferase